VIINGFNELKNVYCHRGFWKDKKEQNTQDSFQKAVMLGFSIETDLRFIDSKCSISHDIESAGSHSFDQLQKFDTSFALNIKEDGMEVFLSDYRDWVEKTDSFFFDGSVPEMLKFKKYGLAHALRLSEYEKVLPWDTQVVWLDSFHSDWWIGDINTFKNLQNKKIVVVSPEIHGRDPRYVWDYIHDSHEKGRQNFALCTDLPIEFSNARK
jgi:hypothetical protein